MVGWTTRTDKALVRRTGNDRVAKRPRAAGSIGTAQLTIGFAQEWLAWHDRRREAIEEARHRRTVFWTRWAAVAATVAGASTAIGWAWTIFHK